MKFIEHLLYRTKAYKDMQSKINSLLGERDSLELWRTEVTTIARKLRHENDKLRHENQLLKMANGKLKAKIERMSRK